MGLILIVIGGVAGWRAGYLDPSAYAILAFGAALVAGLMLLLESRGLPAPLDVITVLASWLVLFLYLAVPYTALAWLKAKRVENRGE